MVERAVDGRLWWIATLGIIVPGALNPAEDLRLGLADLVLTVAVLAGLARYGVRFLPRLGAVPFRRAILVFGAALLIGVIVALAQLGFVPRWALLNKGAGYLVLVVSFFYVATAPPRAATAIRYIRTFVAAAGVLNVVAVVAAMLVYGGGDATGLMYRGDSLRLAGFMKNPNSYGSFVAMALVLQTGLLQRDGVSSFEKRAGVINAMLLLAGLLFTISRAAWFGALGGLLILLTSGVMDRLRSPDRAGRVLIPAVSGSVLVLVMLVTGAGGIVQGVAGDNPAENGDTLATRAEIYEHQGGPVLGELIRIASDPHGTSDRLAINRTAVRLYRDAGPVHWLAGLGLGYFLTVSDQTALGMDILIHNTFLWVLIELGLIGLAALLGLIAVVAFSLVRGWWERSSLSWAHAALLAAGAAHFVWSLAHEGIYQRHIWLVIALAALLERTRRAEEPGEPILVPTTRQ